MTDHSSEAPPGQGSLIEERSKLDALFEEANLYKSSQDYLALLDFVARMRKFAAFNAMLLHLQKPGLSHAAAAKDWWAKYRRAPKEHARPLLIMRPFGPVSLVYDVIDTEGDELPKDAFSFVATGEMSSATLAGHLDRLRKSGIDHFWFDAGDRDAGLIRRKPPPKGSDEWIQYEVAINRNHSSAVQFSTLTHELAHLALGHLGENKKLKIPVRFVREHGQRELEAESVAYIVSGRLGIEVRSKTYLASFLEGKDASRPDVYEVMMAAARVEKFLGVKPSDI